MTDVQVRWEPPIYREDGKHSFFHDLARAKMLRDEFALERLQRHQEVRQAEIDKETRANPPEGVVFEYGEQRANPTTTLGTGGEFAPPGWLISKFKTASRAGRAFGDLLNPLVLPPGVSSIHVPKITAGFTDDIQPGQGSAVPSTDATTSDVPGGAFGTVETVAGEGIVSQQLLDLTPIGFDAAAYKDLHRSYNAKLENQLINGSGINGQLLGLANFSVPAANTVSGAGATTIATLWPVLGQAMAAVGNNRLLQPEVWLMAIRRYAWIASSVDNSQRPISSPGHTGETGLGPVAGGYPPVGPINGLPVYLDGAIPAGTGPDNVYCVRPSDMYLFESPERFVVVVNPTSGTLQVRIQLRRYVAFVGNSYTSGLGIVTAIPQPANF